MRKKRKEILVIGVICAFAFSILPVSAYSEDRWHTGYAYYGSLGYPPDGGVRSTIKTVTPTYPANEFSCQWVSIVLSYSNGYWLQVGYAKGCNWQSPDCRWYVEEVDEDTSIAVPTNVGPTSGNNYNYFIEDDYPDWTCGVSSLFDVDIEPSPRAVRDYQSMAETTDDTIDLDGTYHKNISYKQNNDWVLWDDRYDVEGAPPGETTPYELYYQRDYRFKVRVE